MGKLIQQYMYCRSSPRYCRPQKNSSRPRFHRCQPLLNPPCALEMLQHLFPKVKAGVYVLPKSILPPCSKKISRHSDFTVVHRVCRKNLPPHRCSTLPPQKLDILLVKVKSSGICPAEAICDTATPVKNLPCITDDLRNSSLEVSMETYVLTTTTTTTMNKMTTKSPTDLKTPLIDDHLVAEQTPSHNRQVSVSTLFINKLTFKVKCQLSDEIVSRDRERHGRYKGAHDDVGQNSDIYDLAPNSPVCFRG